MRQPRQIKKEKTLLLHHIDLDGVSVSILYRLQNKLKAHKIVPFNYDEVTEEFIKFISEYTEIIIVDISLPFEVMENLLTSGCKITLIDHHESAYEGDEDNVGLKTIDHPNFTYIYSPEKCGTLLFKEYLINNGYLPYKPIVEHFVELVDTYDRFETESPLWEQAQDLNRLFWTMINYQEKPYRLEKFREYLFDMTNKLKRQSAYSYTKYERKKIDLVVEKEKQITAESLETMQVREDSRGVTFGVIKLASKASIVARNILMSNLDLEYLVIVIKNNYGPTKLSLRSREFDLLQLEGVRGHAQAAGTDHDVYTPEISEKFWEDSVSIPYERPKRKPRLIS